MVCKHLDMTWPVGGDLPRLIAQPGEPGSFWQDRGDRHHAGVDLYAPAGTSVYAIQAGRVLQTYVHTSPGICPYWNSTYAIVLQLPSGLILKYAELAEIITTVDQVVTCGQILGKVGQVLLPSRVLPTDPPYIQLLKDAHHSAMLHLEAYTAVPLEYDERYLGGNYFGLTVPPVELVNPTPILEEIVRYEASHTS